MKLNLYLFHKEMTETITGCNLNSDWNNPKIDYACPLSTTESRYSQNILYISDESTLAVCCNRIVKQMESSPSSILSFICTGTPPEALINSSSCDILWFDNSYDIPQLFHSVQQIIHRFSTWENRLNSIVSQGGGISELVEASVNIIRNDICVTDPSGRVLAYRIFRNKMLSQKQTCRITEGFFLPVDMVTDGLVDEIMKNSFHSKLPTFGRMRSFDCDVIQSTIDTGHDYLIVLSIHANYQPVEKGDCIAATVLAKAIKKLCLNYGPAIVNSTYTNTHSILKALVLKNTVSESTLTQCSFILGWQKDTDEYVCFCLGPSSSLQLGDGFLMKPYVAISNYVEDQLDAPAFTVDKTIVVIINLSRQVANLEKTCGKIQSICKKFNLIAGEGGVYEGILSIPSSYSRAAAALSFLGFQPGNSILLSFDDCALNIAMNILTDQISPEQFCSRDVFDLATSNPELYKTLEYYLEYDCNVSLASRKMGVQRTSFVYRIKKIMKELDIDFSNKDTKLLLMIYCKLIELYGVNKSY